MTPEGSGRQNHILQPLADLAAAVLKMAKANKGAYKGKDSRLRQAREGGTRGNEGGRKSNAEEFRGEKAKRDVSEVEIGRENGPEWRGHTQAGAALLRKAEVHILIQNN